ncbi:hypothetical protein QUA13_14195 [Microcoleus sp. S28C3]|uniref:hypothetical protein n=1 Tax=Microcoleus sp. S28C3 TaxID=3055414 RepID=UPI002FD598D9
MRRQQFPALFHQSSYLIPNTHSELMPLFWWKKLPALVFAFLALLTQPLTQTHQEKSDLDIEQAMQVKVFRIEGCFTCLDFR